MAKPLTSPEERVALFQKLFSDTIPHNKALGLKVRSEEHTSELQSH